MLLGMALSDFFFGGVGPLTHEDLNRLTLVLDIQEPEDVGSKRDRIRWVFDNEQDEGKSWAFAESLVDSLREGNYFDREAEHFEEKKFRSLQSALSRSGRGLSSDGYLTGQALPLPTTTLDEDEVFQAQLSRLRVAAQRDDPEQVIGVSKDLLESVVKRILLALDLPPGPKESLPDLARRAQKKLKLHADEFGPDSKGGALAVRILGALSTIASTVPEYRNLYGTGHGRASQTLITMRHARLLAGATIVYCEILWETLNDPSAPWHSREP